jgi:16S rRNA (cytosine1402-N4)-methyltransferase
VISHASRSFRLLTGKPVVADADEARVNPRARSAKLRAAERTAEAPLPPDNSLLPRFPTMADVMQGGR